MTRTRAAATQPTHQPRAESDAIDAGFSLIEVIVAILVFAIISVGIITATLTIIRMTADNRSREYATNMVASDLDAVRAIANPSNVQSTTITATDTVTNRVYTLTRTATWQSAPSANVSCGISAAQYSKSITDTVTWTGQLATTQAVRGDTVLAPVGSQGSASTGAISVAVLNAASSPVSGVSVSIVPASGGAALPQQPAATDSHGCTSVTAVTPGTYTVTLSRAGYVDQSQSSSAATQNVIVGAGAIASATVRYDAAASYSVTYSPSNAVLPTNLATTFVSYAGAGVPSCVTTSPASSVSLFPTTAGYTGIAGATGAATSALGCSAASPSATCLSVQPAQWPATSTLAAGVGGSSAAASPGGSATLTVRVGTVAVTSTAVGYLTAVSATPTGDGNPGCTTTSTYTFGQVLKSGTVTVGLPFGSWTLYSGASAGSQTTQIGASQLAPANASSGGVTTSNGAVIVTLDPRAAK